MEGLSLFVIIFLLITKNLGSDQNFGDEGLQRYTLNGKINADPFPWMKLNYNRSSPERTTMRLLTR